MAGDQKWNWRRCKKHGKLSCQSPICLELAKPKRKKKKLNG